MRSVVTLGQDEALRLLALAVMSRPENLGRYVGGVELETSLSGHFVSARVIVFDSREEAAGWVPAGPVEGAAPKVEARVLSIVPRPLGGDRPVHEGAVQQPSGES